MLTVSERRACRVPGQVRRTQRYTPRVADDEAALTANIVSLASEYGRYGYRGPGVFTIVREIDENERGADAKHGAERDQMRAPAARP